MKCTSPVSFKLDFFSCSSPVSRRPRKTCFPKKKIKVRQVPHCSRLFKISLRVPAPYPYKRSDVTSHFRINGKGKFINMVTFLFVESECWITETEGGEKKSVTAYFTRCLFSPEIGNSTP